MTRILFTAAVALGLAWQAAPAAGPHHHHAAPPAAAPGCQVVEEASVHEVVRYVIKMVPDTKKVTKWVYDCKDDPFALKVGGPNCCAHGHGCPTECPQCRGPYRRKQLVKIEVVEEVPTTKCVVERVVDKVPCTVYRQVPLAPGAAPVAVSPHVEVLRNPPAAVPPPAPK